MHVFILQSIISMTMLGFICAFHMGSEEVDTVVFFAIFRATMLNVPLIIILFIGVSCSCAVRG